MVFNITGGYLLTDSYIINEDQIITYTSPSVKNENPSLIVEDFLTPLVFMKQKRSVLFVSFTVTKGVKEHESEISKIGIFLSNWNNKKKYF